MRMQRKNVAAHQRCRPGLDLAYRGVAVFHRERERAAHVRGAHALVFAFGHPPPPLSAGGFSSAVALLVLVLGLPMPWSGRGFWNAAVGFVILRFAGVPVAPVLPSVAPLRGDEPITASAAITIFVRNEPPDR